LETKEKHNRDTKERERRVENSLELLIKRKEREA
jgi:hypothetical protein